MSISELAEAKGISRQSMQERVSRLERQGHISLKQGSGRSKLVNVAEFDKAAGDTVDAVRSLNGTGAAPPPPLNPGDPVLAREQARRAAYDADLKFIELERQRGNLIPVADVISAMTLCADRIKQTLDQVPGRADEIAAAVAKDGVVGARTFLKQIVHDTKAALTAAMKLQAEEAAQDGAGEP